MEDSNSDDFNAQLQAMFEESLAKKQKMNDAAKNDPWGGDPPPTQAELNKWVEDMMQDWFIGRHYARANFWDIPAPWSCPGYLQTLTAHPKKWMPLHKMVNRLETGSRFDFWRMVFENREKVPQEEVLQVWYDCIADRGCHNYQRVTTEHGFEEYASSVSNPEMQAASVITNPLLIDDPVVSYRYCQVQKPGWQMLQYIHGRRHQTLRMPDAMRQALRKDNLPAFAMHLDMAGMNVSFSLLAEVLEYGAVGIFQYLLENRMFSDDVIPLPELCCYLAAWFHDGISVPMLGVIDKIHPGVVPTLESYIRDFVFLWYSMSRTKPQKENQNAESTIYSRRESQGSDASSSGWGSHFYDMQRNVHSSEPVLHLAEAAFCGCSVSL